MLNLALIGTILMVSGVIVAFFVSMQIGLTLLIVGMVMDIVALYGKLMDFVEKHGFFKSFFLGLAISLPLMFLWIWIFDK